MIINKVYKGTTPFVKGYKGNILLFEEGGGLPSEYQQVEYIRSTSNNLGDNWIDTGVYMTEKTLIESVVKIGSDFGNYGRIFGAGYNKGGEILTASGPWWVRYGDSYAAEYQGYIPPLDTIINISYGNNQFSVDGVNYYNWNLVFTSSYTFLLFSSHEDRDGAYTMYSTKIYEDGTLIRDYVPCYIKATNEVGLYDLVTQEFYHNLGSVPFIAGGNV